VTAVIAANLRSAASKALPSGVKRRIKQMIRRSQETLFPFTPDDLQDRLRRLGVKRGDVLMVHSAFDKFVGFRGGPLEVIRTLQDLLGPEGTLLMPTLPFRGGAIDYARSDPVFDPRHTVSQMGLLTELFRRSRDVIRSCHPTHSVAAWGRHAEAMIAGHEQADTPCGRRSPYARLLDLDGKVLLAGVVDHTLTFGYFVVEELAPRLTWPVLTPERYPLRWKTRDGTIAVSYLHLYSPRLDHDMGPMVRELKSRNQWREGRVGRLRLVLVRAREIWDAGMSLAERNHFPRELPLG
jgi:aminoglycoside 3-N-acetyltransferase